MSILGVKDYVIRHPLIIFISLLAVFSYIFYHPFFDEGFAYGTDVPAHLYVTDHFVHSLKEYGTLSFLDWDWYCGFNLHYVPPLAYIIIGIVYYVIPNIELVSALMPYLTAIIGGIGMFVFLRKHFNDAAAAVGGLIFPITPMFIRLISSRTRSLSMMLLPLVFYYTDIMLTEEKNSNMLKLGLVLAAQSLVHPMYALISILGVLMYVTISFIIDSSMLKRTNLIMILKGIGIAGLFSLYYLPMYFEGGTRTVLPLSYLYTHIFSFTEMFKALGIALFIFGTLRVILRSGRREMAMFIVGVIWMVFSLGANFPLNEFNFILNYIYPDVTLIVATLAFIFLTASLIHFITKQATFKGRAIVSVFFLVILSVSMYSYTSFYIKTWDFSDDMYPLMEELEMSEQDGRVAYYFERGIPPFTNYAIPNYAHKETIEGHYYSNTSFAPQVAHYYDSLHLGYYDYTLDRLQLYNVRHFIMDSNNDNSNLQEFRTLLFENGYRNTYDSQLYDLMTDDTRSTPILVNDHTTLVIGRYASTFCQMFPQAISGYSPDVNDYTLDFLSHFDTVVLYGFKASDNDEASKMLEEYSKMGTLVIDLFGMDEGLFSNISIMGIGGNITTFTGKNIFMKNEESSSFEIPDTITMDVSKYGEWRGSIYLQLENKYLIENNTTNERTIVGSQSFGGYPVYFIGANLFYYAYDTKDTDVFAFLKSVVESGPSYEQDNAIINDIKIDKIHNSLQFSSDSTEETLVFVSVAHSKNWKAWANDEELSIYPMEGLMVLQIPRGEHEISMRFTQTPLQSASISIPVIMLFIVITWYFYDKRK